MKKIPLSRGKAALVDDADYDWLNQWKWTYCARKNTGYAYRNVYANSQYVERIYMHRAILMPLEDMETDHINGDGLDNRRSNLRSCTHTQNVGNSRKQEGMTSQYKGVCWDRSYGYWMGQIGGKHLGSFESEEEAAIAYNQAARKRYGAYARLNAVPDRKAVLAPPKKTLGKSSRYVGVSWSKGHRCWRAEIWVRPKRIWLGHFESEKEAASVWNMAAVKYRGAKARLNVL